MSSASHAFTQATKFFWNQGSPGAVKQDTIELIFPHIAIKGIGIRTREPMPSPAQEAVTGPGVTLQAPGLNKIVEPKQYRQVDLPGRGLPTGKPNTAVWKRRTSGVSRTWRRRIGA